MNPTPDTTGYFELYNTETEKVEAEQRMGVAEAERRNATLRRLGHPHRWVENKAVQKQLEH